MGAEQEYPPGVVVAADYAGTGIWARYGGIEPEPRWDSVIEYDDLGPG